MTDAKPKGVVKCGPRLSQISHPNLTTAAYRDYEKARELRDRVWEKLDDVQKAMGEAGMISIYWTRDVGPVYTVLSDALGDALRAFTEGSGLEVLITERREGEAVRSCQLEALQMFFPELDITRKEDYDLKVVVSVWKCEGCGAILDDQGVSLQVGRHAIQGGWFWEDGKWTHFCPGTDGLVSEVVKIK